MLAAMGQAINVTSELRDRTVALWVAQERAHEHLLRREWPEPRTNEGDQTYNDRQWKWVEKVSTTDVPDIRRMDIEISQPKSQHVLAKIAVFFAKP